MGHAIQNSRALLNALHDQERTLEMVHCCVGPFNTTTDKDGNNCAILIGTFLADIYLILVILRYIYQFCLEAKLSSPQCKFRYRHRPRLWHHIPGRVPLEQLRGLLRAVEGPCEQEVGPGRHAQRRGQMQNQTQYFQAQGAQKPEYVQKFTKLIKRQR